MPVRAIAAVLDGFAAPFAHLPLTFDDPGPGEVLVRVAAAPFCSTDWMGWRAMRGKRPPVVLGHTLVGTVERAGDGVDAAAGKRVLVAGTPQCDDCFYCGIGRPDQCSILLDSGDPTVARLDDGREVRAAGGVGAYATHALVSASQVHALPDGLPFETAALTGCGVSTAYGAVEYIAEVRPGQSVAVFGLGHLGLFAVQAAASAGAARVIGIDVHPGRRARALTMGASHVIDAGDDNAVEVVRDLTGGRGADAVIEAAGPEYVARQAVEAARRAGTIVLTGVAHSAHAVLTLPQLAMTVHGKRVLGCQNGQLTPRRDLPRWLGMLERGEIDTQGIVSHAYSLDELDLAARRSLALDDITGLVVPEGPAGAAELLSDNTA
ncbi:alcohol dehydrogenase [Pseudoclavibacter endophyticus]|uniref:Zinc-binding dehydrogenase n=1 Tax=Pseudoclavibacter endophyticus TaxID=1778590 RepID=A0A6H9WK01_9MICO|nr:zinc-binding dehydrogenase [Pseudoclavibacter endophyticus]KAB1649186.1 zinc-binding dehydrogenase [Pseudoclavibacter endophyticus]GGA64746.1 alcohol dehydrogenase [Pseudoclavibacter endophyticus]